MHDIAFDAVAFQPLTAKPRHIIAVVGESYTSGEGASLDYLRDYYRETDSDGGDEANRNACHRSPNAWSRRASLADQPGVSIGTRADRFDADLDYHMVACSGAQTENLLPGDGSIQNAWGETGHGAHKEASQIDQGYLDENTTLVALSIGGNDLGWSKVIQFCAANPMGDWCGDGFLPGLLPGETLPLKQAIPQLIRTMVIPSIETDLTGIHARARNARIVLMGYPRLLSGDAWCLGGTLSVGEVDFLNQMADVLADEMRLLTARLDDQYAIRFSDPRAAFENKGVCGFPTEGIHAIITSKTPGEGPGSLISQQSFHPNLIGSGIYGIVFDDTLRALGL